MKKKKIILFVIIFVVLLLCGIGIYKYTNIPFKDLDLNYKELNEDIKSIKKNGKILNAEHIYTEMDTNPSYQGDGYIIHKLYGGDATDYVIYHDGKIIWEYTLVQPLEKR